MSKWLAMGCALTVVLVALGGCDLLDPDRPVSHADTEVFGNLLQVEEVRTDEHAWVAKIRVGVPRELNTAQAVSGQPSPELEESLVAEILVTPETVVLAHGAPAALEDINPGTEVAVLPVLGSTRMMGTSTLSAQAAYLTDFETYRRWRLPGMIDPDDRAEVRNDPERINSDGIEHAPVPVAGGKVLYFAARLRPPVRPDEPWQGARREGLPDPGPDGVAVERSYRTELGEKGWATPRLVRFPGLDDARIVRVSWVSSDETACLVTVEEPDGTRWIGRASRPSGVAPWGEVMRQKLGEEVLPSDAVFLAGSRSKMVMSVQSAPGGPGDLWLLDPSAETSFLPLQPAINSDASEWGPRVGPGNELLFSRGDRQLIFAEGALGSLRLPGPQRVVLTEAAPTSDGRFVFCCLPRYVAGELDQDIQVAAWEGPTSLGPAVPVDDWRPAAAAAR
jgi:hypothetical protein